MRFTYGFGRKASPLVVRNKPDMTAAPTKGCLLQSTSAATDLPGSGRHDSRFLGTMCRAWRKVSALVVRKMLPEEP